MKLLREALPTSLGNWMLSRHLLNSQVVQLDSEPPVGPHLCCHSDHLKSYREFLLWYRRAQPAFYSLTYQYFVHHTLSKFLILQNTAVSSGHTLKASSLVRHFPTFPRQGHFHVCVAIALYCQCFLGSETFIRK